MKQIDELRLLLPRKKHRRAVEQYKQKFANESSIYGSGDLDKLCFKDWLCNCKNFRTGKNLPTGFVASTQFLAMKISDKTLVGMITIRHALTPFLERLGGHIGYSVAPDERGKGYATAMLRLALGECRKLGIERARVTCERENRASAAVIKKCGGEYDGVAKYNGDIEKFKGKTFERYWISL